MQRPHSPTLRRRRLSAELKRARADAKLTSTQAIKALGWAAGKLSQIENAETQKVKPDDLDKMLELYKISDPAKREALHALAQDAKVRGWWSKYREVFGPQSLPDFEAEASAIRTFEGLVIPGLLQTPDYARAVFQGGRYTSTEESERRVKARMGRRDILTQFKPASLRVVLDEAALHRVVGSAEVMAEQLRHLLHMAKLPNIDLQVVPFGSGAHAAFVAPFSILDFPDPLDASIVFVDTASGGLFLEESDEVEAHSVTFGDVQGSAMSAARSAGVITKVLEALESKP
ncbi:helix-turn-helix domain-containing protein [Nocardiopsis quinghaiensis]|uniref:helix-turn-helix domain-containing protein n=1 Tax=Nocardiopsis quinghaiensis TaxID=464995 RepID=UPI00123C66B5|nr:helix-turn-helix transcriptional regulator [Nocardiopsis quinghaiensis]